MTMNKKSGEVIEMIIAEDKACSVEPYKNDGQKITRIEIVPASMKGDNSNRK